MMGRTPKFTEEQKFELALELISGKLSHAEVCGKYEISSTYAYKLKDRALAAMRQGIARPAAKTDPQVDWLRRRVADLEQLAGDQALAIRLIKKHGARLMAEQLRAQGHASLRRIAAALDEPRSSVGRWVRLGGTLRAVAQQRHRPVSGDAGVRAHVSELCARPRHERYGHRRIRALLRREGRVISRKSAWRVMRELGNGQQRVWRRGARPRRVERMRPAAADRAWQIDMTSLALADLTPLFLVVVIDCFSRQIVGWTLDRRCRAGEWTAAAR